MSWICEHCHTINDNNSQICRICGKSNSQYNNLNMQPPPMKLNIPIFCPSCKKLTWFVLGSQIPYECSNCGSHFESEDMKLSQCKVSCTRCDSTLSFRPGMMTFDTCPVCGTPYSPETVNIQFTSERIQHNIVPNAPIHRTTVSREQVHYNTAQVTQNTSAQQDDSPKSKTLSALKVAIACIVIFVLLFIVSIGRMVDNIAADASHSSALSTPTPTFKAISFPGNGRVSYNSSKDALAPFYIDATECSDSDFYYIVLANPKTNKAIVRIYIHKQKTVEVDVPLGTYRCYIASGNIWYGTEEKFGDDGSYEFSEELFTFYATPKEYMGHQMTLYSVYNGNMESEDTDKEHFPN